MPGADDDRVARDRLITTWVELVIRLGVLGLLLALSVALIRPFITVAIWSIVLTVAVYPVYDWMAVRLGGRRRLAALLDFGSGWRFNRNILAEYIFSINNGLGPTRHVFLLRYTFKRED